AQRPRRRDRAGTARGAHGSWRGRAGPRRRRDRGRCQFLCRRRYRSHAFDELDKPVIARVNGNVYGGGVGLVACADIAIGVDGAKFALTEVRLGIVPAVISPYVVAAIGNRHARRLFLTATPFDAPEARSIGLLHFTATAEQLDATVEAQVDQLLRGGPEALRAAKKLVRRMAQLGDREALAEETARLLARLRVSPEGREGLSAFLERRKPGWHAEK